MCDAKNIVLIGMPGSGKSTLGARLAQALGRTFVDMDAWITQHEGESIPALFQRGEAVFRDAETRACRALGARRGLVIACGGGAVLREGNVALLRHNGRLYYLDRPVERIAADIDYSARPLLREEGLSRLRAQYEARRAIYERAADVCIANNGTLEEAVQQCIAYARGGNMQ